jgi:integrase
MSEERAARLARRERDRAEEKLDLYGVSAVVGANRVSNATRWFRQNGQALLSPTRYRAIMAHWDNHLSGFFKPKTVIDKRLQKRMAGYVEYRRRVVDKRSGNRLHAEISTIKLEVVSAKQLLKLAREHAHIGEDVGNLAIGIQKTKLTTKRSRTTTFQDSEVEAIQKHFDDEFDQLQRKLETGTGNPGFLRHRVFVLERLRFFVALAFGSGARVNELRQVRHGDIAKDFKTLRIRKSKTPRGSNRAAYLENEIWDIRTACARFRKHCLTKKKNELVFVDKSRRVHPSAGQSFSKFLKKHRMLYDKIYGERRRNLLAVRHYSITKFVDSGVDAFDVARSVGTSVKMIEETYYEDDPRTLVGKVEQQKAKTRRASLRRVK